MKVTYTNIKTPKRTDEKCTICNRFQNSEDIKYGCEKCTWQKEGVDVVTPYWVQYHESKGHEKTAPCQYKTQ
jgi:hypothetical protein